MVGRNWFCISRLMTIVALGLRKPYATSEPGAYRVMYIMMFIDLLCGCCFMGVQLLNQNTFSQGKKKKGDEVEDEDDDVVARTSSVTRQSDSDTVCSGIIPQHSVYILQLSPHVRQANQERGERIRTVNTIQQRGQLGLTPLCRASPWFPGLPIILHLFYTIIL